jgi:hypothetical protein
MDRRERAEALNAMTSRRWQPTPQAEGGDRLAALAGQGAARAARQCCEAQNLDTQG